MSKLCRGWEGIGTVSQAFVFCAKTNESACFVWKKIQQKIHITINAEPQSVPASEALLKSQAAMLIEVDRIQS